MVNETIILNAEYIYNDIGEPIKTHDFEVPYDWVQNYFNHYFAIQYKNDFDFFLDAYDPATEGMQIYRAAKRSHRLISEGWCDYYE